MYAKSGGVAAYHIVWIGLCLRSVSGVRVLASAVDDSSSTALARTRTRTGIGLVHPVSRTSLGSTEPIIQWVME
jgi:hypothetical protein